MHTLVFEGFCTEALLADWLNPMPHQRTSVLDMGCLLSEPTNLLTLVLGTTRPGITFAVNQDRTG